MADSKSQIIWDLFACILFFNSKDSFEFFEVSEGIPIFRARTVRMREGARYCDVLSVE
jgi:hypothetical protein